LAAPQGQKRWAPHLTQSSCPRVPRAQGSAAAKRSLLAPHPHSVSAAAGGYTATARAPGLGFRLRRGATPPPQVPPHRLSLRTRWEAVRRLRSTALERAVLAKEGDKLGGSFGVSRPCEAPKRRRVDVATRSDMSRR